MAECMTYTGTGYTWILDGNGEPTYCTPESCSCPDDSLLLGYDEFQSLQSGSLISPLNPEIAIEDATAFFALAFVLLVTIWALKKIYEQFTRDNV
jgi:hypothetical protein